MRPSLQHAARAASMGGPNPNAYYDPRDGHCFQILECDCRHPLGAIVRVAPPGGLAPGTALILQASLTH